jgi:hypothetical protein
LVARLARHPLPEDSFDRTEEGFDRFGDWLTEERQWGEYHAFMEFVREARRISK